MKPLLLLLALCAGMVQGQDTFTFPSGTWHCAFVYYDSGIMKQVEFPCITPTIEELPMEIQEEPVDVPAVRSRPEPYAHDACVTLLMVDCPPDWKCADPSRIGPLFDGNRKGHCLLFSK